MRRTFIRVIGAALAMALATGALTSCSGTQQRTPPAPTSANSNAPAPMKEPEGGKIEVNSTPPGAAVMLVLSDEGGAAPPVPRGSTPTTITGVSPGKYVVHLEKPGYKFSQKEVEIKSTETVKVAVKLQKE